MTPRRYLHTKKLSVGYRTDGKEIRLFEDLDLELQKGKLVCFMGPNGAGKSTLIRTLAGLQSPLHGEIIVDEERWQIERSGPLPTKISVVLTDKVPTVNLSVTELVSFGRYPYQDWRLRLTAEDHAIIERSIDQVHIRDLAARKLFEMSDGQRQMAMIARALAQDCPVILLDEPTAHLDLNNRLEIMKLLRDLAHGMDKAILVATHELDLALQTADRIWLAGEDKKIRTGLPEDLVLDGSFDEIFRFKGFDLKTGKINQHPHRGIAVNVNGEGAAVLWTKNALERSGFEITTEISPIQIAVQLRDGGHVWTVAKHDGRFEVTNLSDLINIL